jgi:hypothetical protein
MEQLPTFCRVVHSPTYCVIQAIDPRTNKPPLRNKHTLKSFSKRNETTSKQSISRLKQAVNWMILFSEKKRVYSKKENKNFSFRIAFVTLTLSAAQMHSDTEIKEHLLQPFLYWLNRYYKASYIWKAETQLNGNIHFHLTIDTFVHWKSIRAKWNQLLAKHNYCKVYQDGTNDKGNAATEIKAAKNENQICKYLADYIGKKNTYNPAKYQKKKLSQLPKICNQFSILNLCPQVQPQEHYLRIISGRIWGCSEQLSKVKVFIDEEEIGYRETERNFFHDNKLQRLSSVILSNKNRTFSDSERQHIERSTYNVFTHRNIKFCKVPPLLQQKIWQAKAERNFNTQKFFTIESFN